MYFPYDPDKDRVTIVAPLTPTAKIPSVWVKQPWNTSGVTVSPCKPNKAITTITIPKRVTALRPEEV